MDVDKMNDSKREAEIFKAFARKHLLCPELRVIPADEIRARVRSARLGAVVQVTLRLRTEAIPVADGIPVSAKVVISRIDASSFTGHIDDFNLHFLNPWDTRLHLESFFEIAAKHSAYISLNNVLQKMDFIVFDPDLTPTEANLEWRSRFASNAQSLMDLNPLEFGSYHVLLDLRPHEWKPFLAARWAEMMEEADLKFVQEGVVWDGLWDAALSHVRQCGRTVAAEKKKRAQEGSDASTTSTRRTGGSSYDGHATHSEVLEASQRMISVFLAGTSARPLDPELRTRRTGMLKPPSEIFQVLLGWRQAACGKPARSRASKRSRSDSEQTAVAAGAYHERQSHRCASQTRAQQRHCPQQGGDRSQGPFAENETERRRGKRRRR